MKPGKPLSKKVKSYGTVNPAQVDAFLGRMQPQASSVGFLLATVDTDFIKGQIESAFANRAGAARLVRNRICGRNRGRPGFFGVHAANRHANAQQAAPYTPPAQPAAPQAVERRRMLRPSRPHIPNLQRQPRSRFNPSPRSHRKFSLLLRHSREPPRSRRPAATSHLTGSQIARANGMDTGAAALTFENFIIGDSNRLAYSMAVSVANRPASRP